MNKKLKIIKENNARYKKGLKFTCTGCGKCCYGFPGNVWVTEKEIEQIANFLKLDIQEFKKIYTKKVKLRTSIKEVEDENYRCIFLNKQMNCSIYPVRPSQCKTFPWWPQNLGIKQHMGSPSAVL